MLWVPFKMPVVCENFELNVYALQADTIPSSYLRSAVESLEHDITQGSCWNLLVFDDSTSKV